MKLKNITRKGTSRILIVSSLMLLTTACNNGGSARNYSEETYSSSDYSETALSSDVKLSWAAPSEREDNKPISLSEIAGYKIYYGTAHREYTDSITIDNGHTDSYTFYNLETGTYYFVLTTLDTAGRESQYSDEIKVIV